MASIPSSSPTHSQRPIPLDQDDANPMAEEDENLEEVESNQRFLLFNALPSWLISMIFHVGLIIFLALLPLLERNRKIHEFEVAAAKTEIEELEEFTLDDIQPVDEQAFEAMEQFEQETAVDDMQSFTEQMVLDDTIETPQSDEFSMSTMDRFAPSDISSDFGMVAGGGLGGLRSGGRSGEALLKAGGTEESESAVQRALKWLAAHQLEDGGWDFDHTRGPGAHRKSPNPGLVRARNGATGMALLPFLGAGQTHLDGKYKTVVQRGLSYLIRNQRKKAGGGTFEDFQRGMYSHGICSIALTEAYAMTNDQSLLLPAQSAINYISAAQDPIGGGWRYVFQQPGDTSVVGWQLMALKSGNMAYLQVSPNTIRGCSKFLDSVQIESGAKYGYVGPGEGYATTSIGLLCRMYLGWTRNEPALQRGVNFLSNAGPSIDARGADMYYNYYATQVMRHYGGEDWEKWNGVMRDWLVETQARKGDSDGSWFFPGGRHATEGGRLYCTSMAAMTLEVYYRHLPLYAKKAAADEFPL